MRDTIKRFIENNLHLIEYKDYKQFYEAASKEIFGDNIQGELTAALWSANIHPEYYLQEIPTNFAHSCKDAGPVSSLYQNIKAFGNFCFNYTDVPYVDLSSSSCISIGCGAFQCCNKLRFVILPNTVKTIDEGAFSYCKNLYSINIPAQVKELKDTFVDCKSLTNVVFEGTKQQFKSIRKTNMWRRGSGIKEITCSDGMLRFN